MNIEHKEFISFLRSAQKHKVEYILIGGFSVVYHGYVRGTKDMDIWLRPTNENRDKLVNVFRELEYTEGVEELTKSDFTQKIRFTAGAQPYEIDMMTHIARVAFDEALRDAAHLRFEGLDVPVLEFHHLKMNKLAAMRPKDLNDIRELEKIKMLKAEEPAMAEGKSNSFLSMLRSIFRQK